jgi:hypothetical protein
VNYSRAKIGFSSLVVALAATTGYAIGAQMAYASYVPREAPTVITQVAETTTPSPFPTFKVSVPSAPPSPSHILSTKGATKKVTAVVTEPDPIPTPTEEPTLGHPSVTPQAPKPSPVYPS